MLGLFIDRKIAIAVRIAIMPIFARRLHFPDPLNGIFKAASFGCCRYLTCEETVIMHVLDKGAKVKGAALKRAAACAVEKRIFEMPQ